MNFSLCANILTLLPTLVPIICNFVCAIKPIIIIITCRVFAQTVAIKLICGDHVNSLINKRPVSAVKACEKLFITVT